jgi:hypothetical protein
MMALARAQEIERLFQSGMSRAAVVAAMGLTRQNAAPMLSDARKALGHDLPGEGSLRHPPMPRAPSGRTEARKAKMSALKKALRCPRCQLLLPHYDCIGV